MWCDVCVGWRCEVGTRTSWVGGWCDVHVCIDVVCWDLAGGRLESVAYGKPKWACRGSTSFAWSGRGCGSGDGESGMQLSGGGGGYGAVRCTVDAVCGAMCVGWNGGGVACALGMLVLILNVGTVQVSGASPLHIASQNGHVEVVQALLGAGADVGQVTVSLVADWWEWV